MIGSKTRPRGTASMRSETSAPGELTVTVKFISSLAVSTDPGGRLVVRRGARNAGRARCAEWTEATRARASSAGTKMGGFMSLREWRLLGREHDPGDRRRWRREEVVWLPDRAGNRGG